MDSTSLLIGILAGLLAGIVLTWLILAKRLSVKGTDPKYAEELARSEERLISLQDQLTKEISQHEKTREQNDALSSELSALRLEQARVEAQIKEMEDARKRFEDDITEFKRIMSLEFRDAAQKIMRDTTENLDNRNKETLQNVLNPLKENIAKFEKSIQDKYDKELNDRLALKHEIVKLTDLNNQMREDAQNLTKALKGDNKTQGNWGEMILQRVLESSGLTEGEEFETQHSTTTDEGARIQPDVIVNLPDGKHVVIDSKVSLVAYEQYVNSESDEERNKLVVLHINSLKAHIKGLSEKDYFKGKGINSPDFILLFVPIESSFSLAIRHDEQLYAFALERNVVIVSPTTLLATLRTIHHMWSQERQTRNAQLIAEEAGKLLGAFALFGKEVEDLEKHLLKSSDTFQEMKKRMSEGRGNLVSRIEKLQKLGVKSTRTLPDILRTDDDPDNDNDNGNLE